MKASELAKLLKETVSRAGHDFDVVFRNEIDIVEETPIEVLASTREKIILSNENGDI